VHDEISGCADVVLAQLANPVLMPSALPNTNTTEVNLNICLQAGMQGRTSRMCNPEATSAPIVLYEEKRDIFGEQCEHIVINYIN
jgi:hypothetical protein